MARHKQRRFVVNRRSGMITIRSRAGANPQAIAPVDQFELLNALIEVEEMLSPAFGQDQVPPTDIIALLAEAMYIRLTGELELGSRELRITLCEYILTVWSQGLFTPSAACPYTLEEILAASKSQGSLLEQDEQLHDGSGRAEISAMSQVPLLPDGGEMSAYERLKHDMRGIDEARDAFVRKGVRALHKKQYTRAEQYFRQAVEADMLDESEACYYLALCRLWQRDFDEAYALFEVDAQDREGEAPLSWLLTAWCAMCASSCLAVVRDEMDSDRDPLSRLREQFDFAYADFADTSLCDLAGAVFAYLRGEYQVCLELLDAFVPDSLEIPSWFAPFWSAMALAELHAYDEADSLLRVAQNADIPPLLLLPLRWLGQRHPDFYAHGIVPLFNSYDLWKQVAAHDEREQILQEERRKHLQWLIEHIDEDFPGFSVLIGELDAMRERGKLSKQTAALECRYLVDPSDGVDFFHAYAEVASQFLLSNRPSVPVFLAHIPPPCAPRRVTYLVSELLAQLDDPLAHQRTSEVRKRSRLRQLLSDRQVELVILTNLGNLTTPAGEKVLVGEVEWIRHLFVTEIGSIPLLLVGDRTMIETICEANTGFGDILSELVVTAPRQV